MWTKIFEVISNGACHGKIKSQNGVIGLCKMKIRSNRYDPTTWAKESETRYYFGWKPWKQSICVTDQRISYKNLNEINKEVIDVAFGNGCDANSRVVNPRITHKKNKIKIRTWKHSKRENKAFKRCIRKEKKRWLGHILRWESLVAEVIERWMEGKWGRGKPSIMFLDEHQDRWDR